MWVKEKVEAQVTDETRVSGIPDPQHQVTVKGGSCADTLPQALSPARGRKVCGAPVEEGELCQAGALVKPRANGLMGTTPQS